MTFLTIEDFQDKVGQPYKVTFQGQEVTLILTKVTPRQSNAPQQARKPFSLFFSGPPEVLLEQQMHTLTHGDLGELSIFLVPIGRDDRGGYDYQAVFQ